MANTTIFEAFEFMISNLEENEITIEPGMLIRESVASVEIEGQEFEIQLVITNIKDKMLDDDVTEVNYDEESLPSIDDLMGEEE